MTGARRWLAWAALAGASFGALGVVRALAQPAPDSAITERCTLAFDNRVQLVDVPHAVTPAQQAKGLSGLADVRPGMLFSWRMAAPLVFWMRDTHAPLTIGFFDADGALFQLADMEPLSEQKHYSSKPARYALELAFKIWTRPKVRGGLGLLQDRLTPVQYARMRLDASL